MEDKCGSIIKINYGINLKKKNLISLRLLHDKSTRSGNAAPRSIYVIPIYLCIEGTWDAVI